MSVLKTISWNEKFKLEITYPMPMAMRMKKELDDFKWNYTDTTPAGIKTYMRFEISMNGMQFIKGLEILESRC